MKRIFFVLLIAAVFLLSSCASKDKPPRERDETYIADINAFTVETFNLYSAFGMGQPKVQDFTFIFEPRTNYLYARGRIGIDQVEVAFSYKERQKILAAKDMYILEYETDNLTKQKPSKKNAYNTGSVPIRWGVAGLGHSTVTTYMTNVQYILKDKPYFRILFSSAKEDDGSENSSPKIMVYISPAQWEKIIEACNQERLVELTDAIIEEADEF
ncbi:MAG: hypothetical protein IK024_12290 [Treponema sp.]|nr:hypothetical protein [Treponema sp.]